MEIKELLSWAEFKMREAELKASLMPNEKYLQKEKENYIYVVNLIKKEMVYEPKEEFVGDLSVHNCKCGVGYIDSCFEGYCRQCGQKLRWKEHD